MRDLIRKFLKPYRNQIILTVFLLLIQVASNLYLPNLNANIINNGIAKGDINYITKTGLLMLVIILSLVICSILASYFGSKIALSFGRDLRQAFFLKVENLSLADLDKFGTPSLITRNTNDVHQMQMLVLFSLTIIVIAPLMCLGGIIMALRQDLVLASSVIIIAPLMAIVVWLLLRETIPLFRLVQEKIDKLIIEQGTHEQLIAKKGFYYDLYMSQFLSPLEADN